jgi:formyl-CoA transferase
MNVDSLDAAGPLSGRRVLDLTRALAGPYCSMMLGDMGADVIKIERPGEGDETRAWGPPFVGSESTYYLSANRNKRSITINLQHPEGRELFLRLVDQADIVLENFRPGVVQRLGIDYESVSARNKRIVYCSISAFGQEGPLSQLPGYDLTLQGIGGIMSVTGEEGGRPLKVGVAETDIVGALVAAFAIMNALYARDTQGSGQGRYLDISLLDGQVSLLGYHLAAYLASGNVPRPAGNGLPYIVPYQAFQTATEEIMIAVNNERMWTSFCQALEAEYLLEDARFRTNPLRVQHRAVLIPLVQDRLLTRTAVDWLARLQAAGIPCGPINTMDQVAAEPQVRVRNMVRTVQHPLGTVQLPGIPWKVVPVDQEPEIQPPPLLGQHTDEVLEAILGLDQGDLTRLRQVRAI